MANSSLLQGAVIRQKGDSSRVTQELRLPALPITSGAFLPFWRLVYRLACYR